MALRPLRGMVFVMELMQQDVALNNHVDFIAAFIAVIPLLYNKIYEEAVHIAQLKQGQV